MVRPPQEGASAMATSKTVKRTGRGRPIGPPVPIPSNLAGAVERSETPLVYTRTSEPNPLVAAMQEARSYPAHTFQVAGIAAMAKAGNVTPEQMAARIIRLLQSAAKALDCGVRAKYRPERDDVGFQGKARKVVARKATAEELARS